MMRSIVLWGVLTVLGAAAWGDSRSARAEDKPKMNDLLEKREFKKGKATLLYRLMKPATVAEKTSYPLVIFLHGAGERGNDNTAQIKHGVGDFASAANREKYPCFLIAPQCPRDRWWVDGTRPSRKPVASDRASEPGALVLALIDELVKEFPIDRERIYLTGLSMGGYGTWELLCRKPELFAAGMPICGGGDVKRADKLAKIPIWVFHGDKDTAVPVARSREMVEEIKKAGGEPKYTEYPGVGHDSWTQSYRNPDVLAWLFAQRRTK